jgi:sugar lactone lactonase YvrE
MAQYQLPARNPTMPAFGGPDMKTLFVTTARDRNGGPGGGLYALPVDISGVPGTLFDPET